MNLSLTVACSCYPTNAMNATRGLDVTMRAPAGYTRLDWRRDPFRRLPALLDEHQLRRLASWWSVALRFSLAAFRQKRLKGLGRRAAHPCDPTVSGAKRLPPPFSHLRRDVERRLD